jgi:hypothetical protein
MDKVETPEEADWIVVLKFFALVALIAAVLKFGAMSLVLSQDLKKSECQAAYWKARALGHPARYCPSGCDCGPSMLR